MTEGTKDYQFITTFPAAQFAANMRMQRTSAIDTTYKFTLKSNFAFLSPGDIITITDGVLGSSPQPIPDTPPTPPAPPRAPAAGESIAWAYAGTWSASPAPSLGEFAAGTATQYGGSANVFYGNPLGVDQADCYWSNFSVPGGLPAGATINDVYPVAVTVTDSGGFQELTCTGAGIFGPGAGGVNYGGNAGSIAGQTIHAEAQATLGGTTSYLAVNFVALAVYYNGSGVFPPGTDTVSPQQMFGRTPVRITKMTDDPVRGIILEAENFPWSVGASLLYNRQSSLPSDTNETAQQDPGNTTAVIFEIPDRAQGYNGDNIYVFLNGANVNWGGAEAWVSYNGTDYSYYTTIDTPARIGVTTQYLPSHTDPDSDDTLTVNMQVSGAALQSVSAADRDAFVTLSGLVSAGSTKTPQMLAQSGVNFGTAGLGGASGSQGPLPVSSGTDNPNHGYLPAWSNPDYVTGTSGYATVDLTLGTQQAGPNNSPIPGGAVYGSDWEIASISPNQLRLTGSATSSPHQLGYIHFQNCGFNIPSTATVTGVAVSLGYVSQSSPPPGTASAFINGVALYNGGGQIGTPKTVNIPFQPYGQTMTEGSSTDTWGATLTPAVVNSSTFGFGFEMYTQTIRCFVQSAYVTVYYTTSSGVTQQVSHYLEATYDNGGNFNIPAGGIGAVVGIEVTGTGYVSAVTGTPDVALWAQLIVNNYPAGNPIQVWSGSSYPTSPLAFTAGSPTNSWGLTNLSATQVNDLGFGVLFYATMGGGGTPTATVDVQGVNMKVYWGSGSSGVAWVNPGDVASATSYASSTLTGASKTIWLVAENFGFSLPFGTQCSGIQVQFDAYTDTALDSNLAVQPYLNGQRLGLQKNIQLTTTSTTYNLGNPGDLWGDNSWVVDNWNDPNFGIAFAYSGDSGANVYVRNVRVTLTGTSAYDVELLSYEDATLVGDNTYAITSMRRGILGSFPCEHPAGAQYVRMDNASFVYKVPPQYRGQTIYFKFLSFNAYGNQLQSLADVTAYDLLITDNAIGAIDAATGALVTGTAATTASQINTVSSVVSGTYGVQNVPQGYALVQSAQAGTGTPTWTPIITGGGGGGSVSNIYVLQEAGNFLAAAWDVCLVDTSSGDVTGTLPLASANPNVTITMKKLTTPHVLTVAATGSDTVDGLTTLTINYKGSAVTFVSDGVSNWDVI